MAHIIDYNYRKVHHYLNRTFGKATHCENTYCNKPTAKMFHYALIKGKEYECKRENFIMLCVSCHSKYDCTDEKIKRIKDTRKNKKPIIQLTRNNEFVCEYPSRTEAFRSTHINRGHIYSVLTGARKTAGNYIWVYKENYICNH